MDYWRLVTLTVLLVLSLLLPACAAPTIQPPTGPPPADLQLAHLQQAAYNYARYHALVLRQVYPERSRRTQDRLPDNLLGPSARLRTSLKRLAEVCAALEYPSTEPFGEAQDRLSARAGVEDESCRPTAEQAMGEWSREAEDLAGNPRFCCGFADDRGGEYRTGNLVCAGI